MSETVDQSGTTGRVGSIRPDTVCPHYQRAVELIGRRWSGVILSAMLDGATRFSEIKAVIPDISDRMLSGRLKELEADGLVERTVIPDTPVKVEYRLTEKGMALQGVVETIAAWSREWVDPAGGAAKL